MLYVESSALMNRYVTEPETDVVLELMDSDPALVTSRLTEIEIRRNLARHFDGVDLLRQRREFQADLDALEVVELDAAAFDEAAHIAEETLCRSLDALHLAAARQLGESTTVLTFDRRQARAARAIGLNVAGA